MVRRRPPTFETTSKPWFGPRRRARELLLAHRSTDLVSPARTIEVLTSDEATASAVQHVRFVDFIHREERFRYTIAVCWLTSDPGARQRLYDLAPDFVRRTGWYPLPQGERLRSTKSMVRSANLPDGKSLPRLSGNRIKSVKAAGPSEQGCSLRIELDSGESLLLDAGFEVASIPSDRLVLLSHVHSDHSGGVVRGDVSHLPVAISRGTWQLLVHRLRAETKIHTVTPGDTYHLSDHVKMGCFAVPHLPGAIGYWLDDPDSRVVFTGDISLRTSRHDFIPHLEKLAATDRKNLFLLDATMAGRDAGASLATPAKQLVSSGCDLVIVGESAEHLLYAYIDLFHTVQRSEEHRHTVSFVCSSELRPMFSILHVPFIRRELAELDPFLAAQYGSTMSAWGESRWLYWRQQLAGPPAGRLIHFTPVADFDASVGGPGAIVVYIGRPNKAPEDPRRTTVDTTPWTLHSNQQAVVEATRKLSNLGARVGLFHNHSRRIKKFISNNELAAEVIRSSKPILL